MQTVNAMRLFLLVALLCGTVFPFRTPSCQSFVLASSSGNAGGGSALSTSTTSTSLHSSTSPISPNPLLSKIKLSKTIEVFSTVKEMEASGLKVTSLCVGEPDFPPPKAVLDATIAAVNNKDTRYTAVTGTKDLREAVADDLRSRKGLDYDATEVLCSNGAKQSVYQGGE